MLDRLHQVVIAAARSIVLGKIETLPGRIAAAGVLDSTRVVDRAACRVEIGILPNTTKRVIPGTTRRAGQRINIRLILAARNIDHFFVDLAFVINPALDYLKAL